MAKPILDDKLWALAARRLNMADSVYRSRIAEIALNVCATLAVNAMLTNRLPRGGPADTEARKAASVAASSRTSLLYSCRRTR